MSIPNRPRQRLRSLLDSVRRRWRTQALLRAAGRIALAAAVPILCGVAIARLVVPESGAFAILLAATVLMSLTAVIAVAIGAGVVDLLRPMPDIKVARFIEEQVASLHRSSEAAPLDDVLVSAMEESREDIGFRALVVESAANRLSEIGADRIVPATAIRRGAYELLGGTAVLLLAIVVASGSAGRAIEEAWVRFFPGSVAVQVLPGNVRVRAGKPVLIQANVIARGKVLDQIAPVLTIVDPAGGEGRTIAMGRLPGSSTWFYDTAAEGTFRYRVTAGSARSQEYTVTVMLPARAERIELDYQYPAFTKLAARHEEDGGDIYAPAGTTVRLRIHTDKPVSSGRLTLGAAQASALTAASDRVLEGRLVLARDDSYRVALVDADGLSSAGETEYFIRVVDDRPPEVRILRPAGDQQITPLEEVAIEVRADDDHGIAKLELVYSVTGRPPQIVRLGRASGEPQQLGNHVIAVEDLKVQPGDVITYYARARDVGRGKPSSESRSDMFFLEVRPFSEEFVNAQSQGMSGATGDQIEGLIAAQKEIISATWNIERRAASGAGRSASDISAIAGAQIELKGRAEQMAPSRRRGPTRYPMQVQPSQQMRPVAPGNDPVTAAISAMGRAADHLKDQKPGDALAHEMAALQGLLQAQAEVRRREVAQASAGAGGMGRQGQDLSALFDKELQRQQRTNYETQSRVEQAPERLDHKSALDRIRDLARRQEELSERQRAMADGAIAPEERKRQLEKLMREQEALRQQADDLAKQLGQQQTPQNGARDNARDGSNEVRSASEQMRGAASDLQRQDAAAAAERAGRAAAQLRRLEQQMQSDSPDARERAAGELRMEAQQIADEQQRIAGEAERLEKGAADADALRRLAGEKDALADRVDELRRSTAQLTANAKRGAVGDAEQQAAALGKDLEDQRIAARMRETARQMREQGATSAQQGRAGTPAPRKLAEPEQQIAHALSRAVDRLGGGRTGDAELSRALDRTQRMREDLGRVEQRLRDAEAKAQAAQGGGRQGKGAASGPPALQDEIKQLREEYAQAARRTREELSRLERGAPGAGIGGVSPEGHEWSVTDQGTESFKQDFTQWESLKKDVESALERYEAVTVAQAVRSSLQDRLSTGGNERVPDAYRKLIARYYEALATAGKKK